MIKKNINVFDAVNVLGVEVCPRILFAIRNSFPWFFGDTSKVEPVAIWIRQ